MGPGSGAMPLENRFVIFVVFVRDVNNNIQLLTYVEVDMECY